MDMAEKLKHRRADRYPDIDLTERGLPEEGMTTIPV
jgi:hypothetical protein